MKYFRQITSIVEITDLNVEGCKYLPVFSIICHYFPVNATGMANMLICRHFANLALLSTVMSSLSSIIVHITPCFQQLWPFVYENSQF